MMEVMMEAGLPSLSHDKTMVQDSYVVKKNIQGSGLWKNKSPILSRLDIELTERCNNNCMHCYINLPENDPIARKKELSTGRIKAILKEARDLGCMKVRFTGGEPLLREDFEEIYIFSRRLGLKVVLFTNAALITPAIAKLFKDIPPLEKIEVTVYGMKKDTYESVTRTPGSFELFERGVKLLLENNIPFVVKSALLDSNKSDMESFDAWAAGIRWMDKKKPSYSMFFDLRSRRDNPDKNALIKKLRSTPEDSLRILTRNKEGYVKGMKEFCSKFIKPPGDKLFSCGAGMGGGCVDSYGRLQACMMLRHPETVYDLRDGSLKDGIANFFPKVRQMRAVNPDYLSKCARCFLKGLCEQCPARSWTEYGTLDTPVEYLCGIGHSQAEFLGLVKKGEKAWTVENWKERIAKMRRE